MFLVPHLFIQNIYMSIPLPRVMKNIIKTSEADNK